MTKLDNRFMPDPAVTSTLRGSTAASGTLKLGSTSHATKGNVYLGEAMTGVVVDETNSYTGIGIAPTSPIHFQPVAATTTYGTRVTWTPTSTVAAQTGLFSNVAYTPGAASAQNIVGHRLELSTEGTQNLTGNLYALQVAANHNSSGTCSKLWGAHVAVGGTSAGTISDARGVMMSLTSNVGQTITTSYGLRIDYSNDGTLTTHYALYSATASGATTDYGLYLANTYNYLAGRLGIGSSSFPPAHSLGVYGSQISTNAMSAA